MKTPSFISLSSMLLAGALSLQVAGCGEAPEGVAGDDTGETETASDALVFTSVASAGTLSTATATTKPITTKPTTTKPVTTTTITSDPLATRPAPSGATGQTDLDRNYPWSVFITGTGGRDCRGTLIHPLWVLTAAHCIGPYPGTVRYTRTDAATGVAASGSQRFNEAGLKRGMFVHPGYQEDTGFGQPKNDIALIRLAAPFAIDANIQTAALPRMSANPGRTGTIATNNHSNAPAGYTSIVRTTHLAQGCVSPTGFFCISPPAGSLCHGDSGSGFVELLDGRANVVGVTSNMDGGDDCIAANKQAQMTDVFAYRDWIYGTMGLSPEQVDGRVRVRWSGVAAAPGDMQLECLSSPTTPIISSTMNIPGSEISTECDRVRVWCLSLGANRNMSSFNQRTFAPNGTVTATKPLPLLPTFTTALGEPGSSFLRFDCTVYDTSSPAPPITGGGVFSAN